MHPLVQRWHSFIQSYLPKHQQYSLTFPESNVLRYPADTTNLNMAREDVVQPIEDTRGKLPKDDR